MKSNKSIKKYGSVFIGAVLLAIGVSVFLAPNHIASGGTPGIAIIINYFTQWPLGLVMFCINFPLVLIGNKYISRGFALRTIFSIFISALSVDLIHEVIKYEGLLTNPILASIFGGVFIGFGLGFIINGEAAAGGPSIIAKLISQKLKFREENIIIALDVLIVISAGIIFGKAEIAMLSLVSVYVSAKCIDTVVSGRAMYKMVHISTSQAELLCKKIEVKLNLKGMIVDAKEFDFKTNKKILLLVIESSRIIKLKHITQKYDKDSFLLICDASEIMTKRD